MDESYIVVEGDVHSELNGDEFEYVRPTPGQSAKLTLRRGWRNLTLESIKKTATDIDEMKKVAGEMKNLSIDSFQAAGGNLDMVKKTAGKMADSLATGAGRATVVANAVTDAAIAAGSAAMGSTSTGVPASNSRTAFETPEEIVRKEDWRLWNDPVRQSKSEVELDPGPVLDKDGFAKAETYMPGGPDELIPVVGWEESIGLTVVKKIEGEEEGEEEEDEEPQYEKKLGRYFPVVTRCKKTGKIHTTWERRRPERCAIKERGNKTAVGQATQQK
ncbi:hypothetical protein MMC20_004890 [Loxospora ochrophaea]|nr:hypothetical protein [Loxospora ochrophaea]